MQCLRGLGKLLVKTRPLELVIGSLIKRVLFFVREEFLVRIGRI